VEKCLASQQALQASGSLSPSNLLLVQLLHHLLEQRLQALVSHSRQPLLVELLGACLELHNLLLELVRPRLLELALLPHSGAVLLGHQDLPPDLAASAPLLLHLEPPSLLLAMPQLARLVSPLSQRLA